MEKDISIGIKRKCTSASQIKSSKRKRFQELQLNILDLSDCTLLHVLQFLDATSLYQLGETCTRFQYLVQDESLWIHVDGRNQPNNAEKLAFCWQNVHKKTQHLLLAGSQRSEVVLSLEILIGSEKLNNLTVLALEHQCIKYCKLAQFPNTIQELSFRHSYVPHHAQFFRFSEVSMSNLKTLILDHCQWFEAGSLTSFCKYPKLEILSLYMCKKLCEDDIGSISLAGRFGFKSLKVVDLRFTGVGDLFIKTFYANPCMQVVYFQCFATTYYLERYKRKLDIVNGAMRNEHSYVSDDEANNDMSRRSFYKRFEAVRLQQYNSYTIKDDSMVVFTRLKKVSTNRTRPKSYLYSYPYEDCTCGFFNKSLETYGLVDFAKEEQGSDDDVDENASTGSNECSFKQSKKCSSSSSSESSGDENEWDPKHLLQKVDHESRRQKLNRNRRRGGGVYFMCPNNISMCRKIIYDSCTMPEWCQVQASPSTCIQKWLYAREPRNDYEIAMLEHTEKHVQARFAWGCGTANADCDCISNEGDRAVIIISRNSDGSISNMSTNSRTAALVEDVGPPVCDTIKYLIKKTSECIQRLKTNQCPENEAMTVVNEFLSTVDECLKREEFFKFFDDVDFIRQLCISFYQLSQNVKHNIYYVLHYHFSCFEDLLRQLLRNSSSGAKKDLLKRFFNNLLCSESHLPILNQDCINSQKMREVKAISDITDDNLNMPGPSGLQSFSKIRKACKRKHRSKTKNLKNHSDSDTGNKFSNKNGSEQSSHPFHNSEECNGVEKSSVRNLLSTYIINKRKYKSLNSESDSDEDLENSNVVKYLVYSACRDNSEINNSEQPRVRPGIIENMVVHVVSALAERDTPTNIKELSFRGFPHVTDRTLMLLKELELELLDVTGTNVTQLGVQQFMLYNPQCRLVHETACVCPPKLHF